MEKINTWITTLFLALAFTLASGREIAQAASVTVNSTTDVSDGDTSSITSLVANPGADGVISLREAITAANNTAGSDDIAFNIPGCTGVCTIQPLQAIPTLSGNGTTIDGYTQPGAVRATETTTATLLIEIDGSLAGTVDGFNITSSENTLQGLVINRFQKDGIRIYGTDGISNTISGCYIGTDASGLLDSGNLNDGVSIAFGTNNLIGGDSPAERNIISGNDDHGIHLDTLAGQNTISGNYIGINVYGDSILGNGNDGIFIYSSGGNLIGGDTPSERNIISGNGNWGVFMQASNNTISGNFIGTDVTGTFCRSNGLDCENVTIFSGHDNLIGGLSPAEGNLIACSVLTGARISGSNSTNNIIAMNTILANQQSGVSLDNGATQNTVGPGNWISNNGKQGVNISEAQVIIGPGNVITNNTRHGIYVSVYRSKAEITQNSIYANTLLGIEYSSLVISPPQITSVTNTEPVEISGTACPGCKVEIFENDDKDSEGKTYIGSGTADPGGVFTVTVSALNKPYLTATATDAAKGTSKFSAVFTVEVKIPLYLPIILR